MIADELTKKIGLLKNNKAKLEVAELILKMLKINYEIVTPKTQTSRIKSLMYDKPLAQVHDILASSDNGSKLYAEQLRKDFEARRYWRKQFQKFHKLPKFQN